MANEKRSSIIQFFLIFAVVYLGSQLLLPIVFPNQFGKNKDQQAGVFLTAVDSTVKGGHHPVLSLANKTQAELVLEDRCPMPPVDVFLLDENDERTPLAAEETVLPCTPLLSVPAGQTMQIDLAPWKYSLFEQYGTYDVVLPLGDEMGDISTQFSIHEAGAITRIFRTFITKPLLNGLIFVASVVPGHSLGWSILILTLIVKLLLFIPTQHAMEGQRKLQALQPKLDDIKKQFKDDAARMNQEVMALWKKHNVNPFQSCLPILIQFPVLIGLFYTIRDGSVLALSRHLLYAPYANLPWTFDPHFFGLDLLVPSVILFPPLLVVSQFLQMKLSFALAKRRQEPQKQPKKKEPLSQQEMQQRMMLYGLPLMIGFFAFQFPAAVSLYWFTSTLFAIGQQLWVNRKVT